MGRGSSSIEYMFIVGIALAALAIIIVLSMNTSNDSIRIAQAKDSVDKLAKSADYVYSLGAGSKDVVKVNLPHGIRFINVTGDRIHMRISLSTGETDVYAKSKSTRLIGTVPQGAGEQRVYITALTDGSVLFGESYLSCSPSRISNNVLYDSPDYTGMVTITNIAKFQITGIAAALNGSVAALATNTAPAADLANGSSTTTELQFSPSGHQTGVYSGMLEVTGSNGSRCFTEIMVNVYKNKSQANNESDTLPPIVQIIAVTCEPAMLYVYADDRSTGGNNIKSCEYRIDGGPYLEMNPYDGAWNVNQWIVANATLPDNATHLIEARCYDSMDLIGIDSYSDSCTNLNDSGSLHVNITKAGPLGATNLSQPPTIDEPVEILANCNSTEGGYIVGADIQFDYQNSTYAMTPVNGYFNTSSVGVGYVVPFMSAGMHTITVWCMDLAGHRANDTKTVEVSADTAGPVIMSMINIPSFITTISNITVAVTASDSYTGNSNITFCKWKLDSVSGTGCSANVGWTNVTGLNGSVTVNFDLQLGALKTCTYSVQAYCGDSKGNNGSAQSDVFKVAEGDIMLVMDRSGSMGTLPWSNPERVKDSDNSYATITLYGVPSEYIYTTNFDFSAIPAGANIVGIEVRVERKAGMSNAIVDDSVRLMKSGIVVGSDYKKNQTWGTTDATATYGGPHDLWGTTWSKSDFTSNAGVAFAAHNVFNSNVVASVDYISMTVYYTE